MAETTKVAGCPLCDTDGGVPIWTGERFRVIRAEEPGFPAFYRLVWTDHVAEFSDLDAESRIRCMEAVATVERVLPILEGLQINKHVVPYLLACSEGAMHLSIALPGQNVPYTDLPGLTFTVDPYTLDVSLDAIPLGPLGVDLLEIGGTALLECLRAEPGGEITPLGWRKDWQPHLAMMAGVVADAHAATRD